MAINYPRLGMGEGAGVFGREKEQGSVLRRKAAALARFQRAAESEFVIHDQVGGESVDLLASRSSTNSRCLPAELRAVHAGPDRNALLGLWRRIRAPQKYFLTRFR